MKSTSVADERVIRSEPQNSGSFSLDRATYPAPLSFASQKRTLAFYSSMENAPFGLNTDEIAYFKKVCKSVRFFAQVREMTFPDWQSGAVAEPDWGVGMQVFGRGFFDIGSFVPRSRVLLFFSLVCFSNSKLIQSANPRDQASPQASAGTGGSARKFSINTFP